MDNKNNEYEILLNELRVCTDKWAKRLSYHANNDKPADIHDCYLCSTIMYEIERVIQDTNIKIAQARRNNLEEKYKAEDYKDSNNHSDDYTPMQEH